MNKEEDLPPPVKYWLSPDTKHDCYFIVSSESGKTERIGAFKSFLMGYSEPLRAMLQDSELAEQGDISIVDIAPETFRDFLKCLYMGLTDNIIQNLSFQKCCDLLYVADKYIVTLLKEKVIKQCLNTLSSDINCITTACSSKVFMQEACLKMALSKIVQSNIKSIISSAQFFQMTDDSLVWILGLDPLEIDEISLWKAVLKWAKNKTNSNNGNVVRQCTLKLLKYIRFCSINVQDFCKEVVPTDVLIGEEVNQICKYYGTKEIPNMEFICNVVTSRCHVVDLELLPKDVNFSYRVEKPKDVNFSDCVEKPKDFKFPYRVENLFILTNSKSNQFRFLDLVWHLLCQRRNNEFELFLVREGSMHDPSWKYRVKATLTLENYHPALLQPNYNNLKQHNSSVRFHYGQQHNYKAYDTYGLQRNYNNLQQHNNSVSFPYRTYCSEEPIKGCTKFLLCSANLCNSGFSNNICTIMVTVTISS